MDLKDFYPSIHAKRVRKLFKDYLKCNKRVTEYLVQLCCKHDYLVQGSPVSAILSNMACKPLDLELKKICGNPSWKHFPKGAVVSLSRYSDDIAISIDNFGENLTIKLSPKKLLRL